MSRENVEIVRGHFEATNRRDWAAVMAGYDEEVVLVVDTMVAPDARTVCGRDAVGKWFGDWFRSFADYRFDIEEARSVGDRVFLTARHHAHGRASGVEVEGANGWVYTVQRGKIVRVELYRSRSEALKAVGLEE